MSKKPRSPEASSPTGRHQHHHPMERPEDSADLRAILRDNDEEHLFRFAMELGSSGDEQQEAPLILHWQHAREFVEAVRTLPSNGANQQLVEPPFQIPSPLTERGFKVALLEYLRCENEDTSTEPVETSILPYTVDYLGSCASRMVELRHHPWTQQVIRHGGQRLLPLAVPYLVRSKTEIVKRFLGTQTKTLWS